MIQKIRARGKDAFACNGAAAMPRFRDGPWCGAPFDPAGWPDDFRGSRCSDYGCSPLNGRSSRGTLCYPCADGHARKIAKPGRECDLGDEWRAMLKLQNEPCFTKPVIPQLEPRAARAAAAARHNLSVVMAMRTFQMHMQPGKTLNGCSLNGERLRVAAEPATCARVVRLLNAAARHTVGHDAAYTNFLIPDDALRRPFSPSSSECPVVAIDLSEYIWPVVNVSERLKSSARLASNGPLSEYAKIVRPHRPMSPWLRRRGPKRRKRAVESASNCDVLQEVFPCFFGNSCTPLVASSRVSKQPSLPARATRCHMDTDTCEDIARIPHTDLPQSCAVLNAIRRPGSAGGAYFWRQAWRAAWAYAWAALLLPVLALVCCALQTGRVREWQTA